MSCPDGFQWDLITKRCYTTEIYQSVKGYDVVNVCQSVFSESFPVEPRDNVQMNYIKEVAGETWKEHFVKLVIIWPEYRWTIDRKNSSVL